MKTSSSAPNQFSCQGAALLHFSALDKTPTKRQTSIALSAIKYDIMAEVGKVLHFQYAGIRTVDL